MGYLKYVKKAWNEDSKEVQELMKERKIQWRNQPATTRIARPTRLDRARSLGYKPKKGIVVVRQRMIRGGRQRPDIKGGRRPTTSGQRKVVSKNYQALCEERASKKYPNCEVLNSYFIAKDGRYVWYEIILIDRDRPEVFMDKTKAWAFDTRGRAERGLTSAGRKGRGLRKKGMGSEKTRSDKNGRH